MKMKKRGCLLAAAALLLVPALALAGGNEAAGEGTGQSGVQSAGVLERVTAQPDMYGTRRGYVKTTETDGTSALYEAPDEKSGVLMRYYSGAPVEVMRLAGAGFYQVQIGEPGAGVMGYMRTQDVETGDAAQRVVIPSYMELTFNSEADVYAYCDEGAQRIGMCVPGKTYYAMSKNDGKWVQLFLPPKEHVWQAEDRLAKGFVKLETGMAIGHFRTLWEWTVEPRMGEITQEEAVRLAIGHLTSTRDHGLPEVYTQREALEAMGCRAQLRQMETSLLNDWQVYFWEQENSDFVSVYVYADAQGNTQMDHRYWPAGEYPYGVAPML